MSNQETAASYFSESGSVFTGEDAVDNAAFLSSNNDAAQVQIVNGSCAKLGLAARKAPNLPKLRDIFRCNKLLSEVYDTCIIFDDSVHENIGEIFWTKQSLSVWPDPAL